MAKPKSNKRKWIIGIIVIAVLLVIILPKFLPTNPLNGMISEQIQLRDIELEYNFSGNLSPISDEIQTSQDSLKIKELYVAEDDIVTKGDLLLRATDGTRIFANVSGTIETLYVKENDSIQSGSQIAEIIDYKTLEVSIDVDEYDIKAIEIGKMGNVTINALDTTIQGEVCDISQSAQTTNGISYYKATMKIEAPENVLSGMSVDVSIPKESIKNAISLSLNTVLYDETGNPYVYIMNGDKLSVQNISLGISDGQFAQVLSGLNNGDTVYYKSDEISVGFTRPGTAAGSGSGETMGDNFGQ